MNNWKEDEAMGRVMRFAGKTRREVSNPCLSANDTIALANRIARERADAQAEIARLRGALEKIILLPPHPMRLKSLTIATEALR